MSRWHEKSCTQPVIQVEDDDVPWCTSCGSRYRWQEHVPQNESSNSVLGIPEAGPSDRMSLRWPGSVPYKSILGNSSPDPSQSGEIPAESNTTEESKPLASPIYGDTLAADEFRLACLTAVEGDNELYPLHVSLEVFKDHNCPEYETVSYTWGGEEGDYSLSRPIFIGPFWDVLFQTRNCWEMLRYCRPWRGTRMVWVDALCINQANIPERGQQVAKMARIYEHCMRAIVYLGSDIVLPQSKGNFPTRSRLLNLASGSVVPKLPADCKLVGRLSLADVLARQYFSRVWVIQELLLSRQTVTRIGDVDFWTDSTPWGTSEEQKANLESMQAPWVRYLAQKTFTATNILGVLQNTASSKASDPRDKIFGLLSLVGFGDVERRQWQPDYSIPPAHIFTGFFAHCIANLEKLVFLFFAAGTDSAPSSCPSWVPDWSTPDSWQQLMNQTLPEAPVVINVEGYKSLSTELWGQKNKYFWDWAYNGGAYRRWNDDIAVCTDTGALSLNLTHICKIPTQPIPEASTESYRIRGRIQNIYLVSARPLDRIVQPGHDHVFVLAYKNKPKPSKIANPLHRLFREKDPPLRSSFYVVLRETERPATYRLVATCTHLLVQSEFDGGGPSGHLGSVHSHLISARRKMEKHFGDRMDISSFFPGAKIGYDLLPMIKGLDVHGNSREADLAFRSAYLAWLDEKLQPSVVDEYVEMTLPISDAKRYNGNQVIITLCEMEAADGSYSPKLAGGGRNAAQTMEVSWDYRRYNKWAPILDREPETLPLLARRDFRLRICITDVAAAFRKWLWDVAAVQRVLKLDYEDFVKLLRAPPKEEYHCIGCPSADTQHAMEDFGLEIYTDRVHIL